MIEKKHVYEKITGDMLEESKISLQDMIREAHIKAMQEGIQANTVLLSEHFAKVNGFPFVSGNYFIDIPPMICGLEVRVTNELPEKYDFAVISPGLISVRMKSTKGSIHSLRFVTHAGQ